MEKNTVALISGGLDSILAARIIREQGYAVTGLYFTSAFSKSYGRERTTHAAQAAQAVGIDLRIIDMGQEYIDLIRNPSHGYGKNSNPCIDCKIFMLTKAKAVMNEVGARFVVTGEVLGQRPMSQRRDTFHVIERDAGLRGLIVRPLSATLLPPTEAEEDGLIDREKLLGISGRSRAVQLQLASRFGITGYSTPAGGCLLTDKNFSARLRDLFQDQGAVSPRDIQLLTMGRHFRFSPGAKVVLGRDNRENKLLLALSQMGDYHLFSPHGFPGPVAVFTGIPTQETKQAIGRLMITYSKEIPNQIRRIRFNDEIFDPGDPIPLDAMGIQRVGTGE